MDDDRELLEKAAKAAGLQTRPDWFDPLLGVAVVEDMRGPAERWNPLRDDALALRLAVKLNLDVDTCFSHAGVCYVFTNTEGETDADSVLEVLGEDRCAGVRRAIVRAAAALSGAGTRTASDE